MGMELAALGEILIDFVQAGSNEKGVPVFEANPGGAPANVCAAFSKLGGKSSFIGKVGRDAFGLQLRGTLESLGICVKGLVMANDCPTSLAFVCLDDAGDRSFTFYRKHCADTMLRVDQVPEESWNEAGFFHFGSVSLSEEPARSATLGTVKRAKGRGLLISYDPNYRSLLYPDADPARKVLLQGLALADIVKVSEEEMELLSGNSRLDDGSKWLMEYCGACLVVVTLGKHGVFYRQGHAHGFLPTFDVPVVDTTGAGDAFVGSLLYRLRNYSREQIAFLPTEELEEILNFCNAYASLSTTRYGAIPAMPNEDEVRELMSVGRLLS